MQNTIEQLAALGWQLSKVGWVNPAKEDENLHAAVSTLSEVEKVLAANQCQEDFVLHFQKGTVEGIVLWCEGTVADWFQLGSAYGEGEFSQTMQAIET